MIGERDSQLKRVGRALEARDKALEDARLALAALRHQPPPAPAPPGTPGGRAPSATARRAFGSCCCCSCGPAGFPCLAPRKTPAALPRDAVPQSWCPHAPPWSRRRRAGGPCRCAVVPSEAAAELQQLREAQAVAASELRGARAAAEQAQQAAAAASQEAAAHRGLCAETQGRCQHLQAQVCAHARTPCRRPPSHSRAGPWPGGAPAAATHTCPGCLILLGCQRSLKSLSPPLQWDLLEARIPW